jgi:hypothetical protein
MNTATLNNLLPNAKIKLADNNVVLILSIFYNNPRLLCEDGWNLLKIGSENILIDSDTAHIAKDKEIELVWDKDHITHLKLTSMLKGDALKQHWEDMLTYAGNVQRDATAHFDKNKVNELCDVLNDMTVSTDDACSDLPDTDRVPDKTPLKEAQSPLANTS